MPRRRRDASDSRSDSRRRGGGGGGGGGGRGRSRKRSRSPGRGSLDQYGNKGKVVDKKASGFGFIRPESGQVDGNDLYFHCSACKTSFDTLQLDDLVTYEVGRDKRNGRALAESVQLIGGNGKSRDDSRDRDSGRGRGGGGGGRRKDSRSPSYGRRR
eukprot:TRINITY_DN300_c1_g1_i1.p1 TRINITY_DN300_c1_g1~~TRINITY_DN300_c1_g1_i1.p1  ORF type:complete len:157 (-),score=40.48 TRINITY_DN300_c1_g1_i1:265-735(-)